MEQPNTNSPPPFDVTVQNLTHAAESGVLGSGPRESKPDPNPVRIFVASLAWSKLLIQFVWSSSVVAAAYFLGQRNGPVHTLTAPAWISRLNVPSSVTSGVGWALFVLLGFFIRDATKRYRNVSVTMLEVGNYLRYNARTLLYNCPPGTWHPGDLDRIMRHFIAFPIALKMSLRGEREREQLEPILHPKDVDDVINADSMHTHCTRVIRAYWLAVSEDIPFHFKYADAEKIPCGGVGVYSFIDAVDKMDYDAQELVAYSEYRSSIAYLNHLKIFLYIWMMFLPLSLVETSGWFTVLWSVLITHGIGMLFNIAMALNDPFGFDLIDVKLNRISAKNALLVAQLYLGNKMNNAYLVDPDHDTPAWLDEAESGNSDKSIEKAETEKPSSKPKPHQSKSSSFVRVQKAIVLPMLVYVAWCCFIVFFTWNLTRNDPKGEVTRWWDVYIPLDSSTAGYVSLGIFLLLGFWLSDAYGRYWRAVEIWQAAIPAQVDDICMHSSLAWLPGLWHQRDRERFFSFLAAFPFVAKQSLRGSTDYSELDSMLGPKDVLKISEAMSPTEYVLEVLRGYMYAADSLINLKIDPERPACGNTAYMVDFAIRDLEEKFHECVALRVVSIPSAFTSHLYLFTVFWLALLPLTLVIHDGFISFLYLIPVGYSIINLLIIGQEMSDPFGTDEHDLPLDTFCEQLKEKVQAAYAETRKGLKGYIVNNGYNRSMFKPVANEIDGTVSDGDDDVRDSMEAQTIMKSIKATLSILPRVSPIPVALSLIWSIAAVFLSRWLSFRWKQTMRNNCTKWCSPIDVKGSVLGNIGFALFMILGFRASDAIGRYEEGGDILKSLRLRLRNMTLDFVTFQEDGEYHYGDKERLVAHLAQIPLCLRDMLLGSQYRSAQDTLLNDEDYSKYINAQAPMEYLLQTLGAYLLALDVSRRDEVMENGRRGYSSLIFNTHLQNIRAMITKAMSVKRFPVIPSYTNHQHLFTILWLFLLPLSMISEMGYYTILWAPLISYGILCLESIAVKLVDPYGTDDIDLPVDQLCRRASSDIVKTALAVDWGTSLVHPDPVDATPQVVSDIKRGNITYNYTLPHLTPETSKDGTSSADTNPVHRKKPKPSFYAHLLESVPWWALLVVTAWTVVGCVISYVSRDRALDKELDWWQSHFAVSSSVGTYLSFVAFTLLGFYVNEALSRYNKAGDVWGYSLRKACHITAHYFLSMVPRDRRHQGDHERIVGHIAALPAILKAELRDHRDIREVRGLLSHADIGRIQCAPSMSRYCLDVLYSYFAAYMRRDMVAKHEMVPNGVRTSMTRRELFVLEQAVDDAVFVKEFPIAPGFITVLNCILGLFFLILPFILAPVSGWLTIIWIPIVAYGILGMYKVAGELQNPYGSDLNDLDLDPMAEKIMREVIFVFHQQREGCKSLITEPSSTPQYWIEGGQPKSGKAANIFKGYDSLSRLKRLQHSLHLAATAVPLWLLLLCAAWSAIAVTIAYLVSKYLPQRTGNASCTLWFCSAVAVDSSIRSYVGFSLFLLLGFFLYDSHWRFVYGLELWRKDMIRTMRGAANRIFQAFYRGYWHRGDAARLAGHMAASVIALKGELQGKEHVDELLHVLSPEDARRVAESPDQVDYCIDVIRSYMSYTERTSPEEVARQPGPGLEIFYLDFRVRTLGNSLFQCRRIVSIPLPFGYVQHLRIFLAIWILLLPFSIVESTGWISILWVSIISYGIIGIERWAHRLSDPFGDDLTDLPLTEMAADIMEVIRSNLVLFENGIKPFIIRDRSEPENTLPKAKGLSKRSVPESTQSETESISETV